MFSQEVIDNPNFAPCLAFALAYLVVIVMGFIWCIQNWWMARKKEGEK